MPLGLGGETIGTAFVRILADGSGLDKDVQDQVDDALGKVNVKKSGEHFGDDINEGIGNRLGKGPKFDAAMKNFRVSVARGMKVDEYFEGKEWKDFIKVLRDEFGEAGRIAGVEIEENFRKKATFTGLSAEILNIQSRVNQAQFKLDKERDRHQAELQKKQEERIAGFHDLFGKVFGKGSRNNFLNFFGTLAKGFSFLPGISTAFRPLFEQIDTLGPRMTKAFSGAGGGMKGFSAALAEGGALLPALGAAAVALIPIFMGLASTISLVAGAVVALSGTIGVGLVGAVSVAAGALLPLAIGIGAVASAYIAMSDAQKKALKADLKPFTSAFGELSDIAGKNIFGNLGAQLQQLVPTLQAMAPLVGKVSSAISGQISAWTELVSSGGFKTFNNAMQRDLPTQISLLGQLSRSLSLALTGIFAGLSPVVTRFLGDFDRLIDGFQRFVNSAKGQRSVTNFFNDAYEAAKSLGDAALQAIRVLGNLLRAGAKFGGNKLFDDMAAKFKEWNKYLTDPANQEAIQGWVKDGAEFAKAIGKIVVEFGKLIAAMDSPIVRKSIVLLFTFLTSQLQGLTMAIDVTVKAWDKFMGAMGSSFDVIVGPTKAFFGLFGGGAEEVAKKVDKMKAPIEGAAASSLRLSKEMAAADAAARGMSGSIADQEAVLNESSDAANDAAGSWFNLGQKLDVARFSMKKMIEQMNIQATALINFTANARTAADRGLDKGLIAKLKEAGPAGARAMAQLANGTETEIARANRAWKRGQDAIVAYNKQEVKEKKIEILAEDGLTELEKIQLAIDDLHDKTVTITVVRDLQNMTRRANVADARGASGGVFGGPTRMLIGEAGPEALVPLRRPLGLVDPSVRALSAIAQGFGGGGGSSSTMNRTIDVGGINITTPTKDPGAVAQEVVNRLAAVGY